jgi:flagellar hook-length control protein FliK
MKGGEKMPNLSIRPAVVIPNVQVSEDFPTIGADNHPADSQKSDFSKALAEAVHSKQSKPEEFSAPRKQEAVHPKDTSFEQKPQKQSETKESQQTQPAQQSDQKAPPAAVVKDPDQQPTGSDSQSTTASGQSQSAQPVVPADNKDKAPDTKTNQDPAAGDVSTVAALLAQIAIAQQPLVADTSATVDNNLAQAVNQVSPVITATPSQTIDPPTGLSDPKPASPDQVQVTPAAQNNSPVASELLQSMMIAEPAVPAPALPTKVVAQSTTSTVAVVQSLENLTNSDVTAEANPTPQTPQPATVNQNKTNDPKGPKFSALMDGKAVEVQATGEVKAGDAVNQPDQSQKGMVDPNVLQAPNSKGGKDLTPVLNDSSTTTQLASNAGKSQTLNIPLIQTQLAGNSSSDKVRNDLSVVSNLNPQPMSGTNSEIAAATVNHVNKDDLFAQIVEKAKVVVNNGNSEMEISLKPEHLGKLQLKISVVDQTVTAKFVAESQQVKEVIETHLNQLRRNLQDNGVQVDQLMVSVGQQNGSSSFQEASHNQAGFTQSQNHSSFAATGEISGESASGNSPRNRVSGDTLIDLIA